MKENIVEKLKYADGENKGLTKYINNMRAVINTSAPRLGEEGAKSIGDLKRQMVLMEEENMKLFNERKTNILMKIPKKYSKLVKIWRLFFSITIADLKQII